MKLGLARGTVKLVAHEPGWGLAYLAEAAFLLSVFGRKAIAIDHIDSTAISGIKAKPIIDILVQVKDLKLSPTLIHTLARYGYEERPSAIKQERIFAKGPESRRTHYVHVTSYRSRGARETLLFRDRLRADTVLAKAYEKLKMTLAKKHATARMVYTKAKEDFIRGVISRK